MPDDPQTHFGIRLLRRLGEPPRYIRDATRLNKLGLQVGRVLWAEARHRLLPSQKALANGQASELEKRGILVIPNFLPRQEFVDMRERLRKVWANPEAKCVGDEFGTGIDCTRAAITNETEDGRWIIQRTSANPLIASLVQAVTRRRMARLPKLVYQRLEVPQNGVHHDDVEAILHADRHFPTAKAFISLTPTNRDNGAYVWCDGTHRLTLSRLRYEYEFSTRRTDKSLATIRDARLAALAATREELRLSETVIETDENTLVVSDNRGFHRRGMLSAGTVREQLRMTFHYMQEPVYMRLGVSAMHWLSERDSLPVALKSRLRRAGFL